MYIIVGYDNCLWCNRAAKLLEHRKQSFKKIEVPKKKWKECIKELTKITNIHNHKTSPIIFYDSRFIGGYMALVSDLRPNLEIINALFK